MPGRSFPTSIGISLALAALSALLGQISEPRAAERIRIGYGSLTAHYAPIWLASDAQLYRRNGLDAEVLYLESALVRTTLIAGDVVAGGMSASTMAAPRLQGADTVLLASFLNSLQYRLVVRPEIKSVADLKGKRVAVAGFGLGAHRAAQIVLSKLGLNPDSDVILLQTGGEPTRIAAMVSRAVDATVLNPPAHNRALDAGMRVLANMEDMNFPFLASSLVTTERFVKTNPDSARRIVRSIVEAIHLIKTNAELSKRTIGKYMRVKEGRDTEEAYQIVRDVVQKKPYPTIEGLKPVLDDLAPKMPAAKTANPREFIDARFIDELDRAGFIDRLYQ